MKCVEAVDVFTELQRNSQPFDAGAELRQQQGCEHTQRQGERAAPHRAPSTSHKHWRAHRSKVMAQPPHVTPAQKQKLYEGSAQDTQKQKYKQRDDEKCQL